jgi:hypothetical protein
MVPDRDLVQDPNPFSGSDFKRATSPKLGIGQKAIVKKIKTTIFLLSKTDELW